MAKTARVAVAALSGVMMMALGAEGLPWGKGKGVAKRKVSLFVEGTGCAHDIEAKPVKLEKAKLEALGWRIQNDCNIGRKVLLCMYDAQGKLSNPFDSCASVPPGLGIAAAFTLAAGGGKAEIDCPVKGEGNYLAAVFAGDEVKGACPAAPPKERAAPIGDKTFTHRLAVEIVP
jgi:hypothetical protein